MRRLIFWIIILLTVSSFSIYKHTVARPGDVNKSEIISLIHGAVDVEHFAVPIDHYKLYGPGKKILGYVVRTSKLSPNVVGYGGEIDSLVGIDDVGQITSIKILSHRETETYMAMVLKSGLLGRMIGLRGKDVGRLDVVTGATASSKALIGGISSAASKASSRLIGLKSSGILDAVRGPWKTFLVFIPLITGLVAIFLPRKKYLRHITLLLSVVIIGFLVNTPITISNIIDVMDGSFFVATGLSITVLLVSAILLGLLKGPFYCSYICPFGAVLEGAAALLRKREGLSEGLVRYARHIRYPLVLIVVASVVFLGLAEFKMIEPFSICFSLHPPRAALIQTGIIVVFSIIYRRIWCRFLCPTGFFMEAVSSLGVKVRRVLKSRKDRSSNV